MVCKYFSYNFKWAFYETNILGNKFCDLKTSPRSIMNTKTTMIGVGNLEVIHTGTLILYDWDILGSSIYTVDVLRIDDLRIDDWSSILRSSILSISTI